MTDPRHSEIQLRFREGGHLDMPLLKNLGLASWSAYQHELTPENWCRLSGSLSADETYRSLLATAYTIVCETRAAEIIGMAFLVPKGHPTEIYHADWSYIRFVSVHPDYQGLGIGRKLTALCIAKAKENGEKYLALHTSEMMNSARHIYESLGFRVMKELPARLGKKYWLYMMELT